MQPRRIGEPEPDWDSSASGPFQVCIRAGQIPVEGYELLR